MKVIAEKTWELEIVCESCESTLMLEENDIDYTQVCYWDEGYESIYSFNCVVCGTYNRIEEEKLPTHVRLEAIGKYNERRNS